VFVRNGTLTIPNGTLADDLVQGSATVSASDVFVLGDGTSASAVINNSIFGRTLTSDYGQGTNGTGGSVSSSGSNNFIFAPGAGATGFQGASRSADPMLDPAGLKDNGGPTQTIALQPGSPAIDAGSDSAAGAAGLSADQRGLPFVRDFGAHVDVGAFEVQLPGGAGSAGATASGTGSSGTGTVSGVVFADSNLDGTPDAGEAGVSGVTVFLDANGNGKLDPGEPSAVSGPGGTFTISGVAAGSYVVSINPPSATGLQMTDSLSQRAVSVGAGATAGVNLGVASFSEVFPLAPPVNDLFAPHPNADADAAFVEGLYRAILGRAADASGEAGFVADLHNGTSRAQIEQSIFDSAEHRGQEVDAFYQSFLGRAADAGRAGFVSQLQSGVSEEQVALEFLTSPEFNALHPDNASFVAALYSKVLGRQAGAAELAADAALLSGVSRGALAQGILRSAESLGREVDALYVFQLHRGADASGRAGALADLSGGTSTAALEASLFASTEFADDAIKGSP
jgi:hypothetical protein